MIAGDAHLVAADDGSNNDYSDNGGAGFPLFQSAPMDNYGSDKARNLFSARADYSTDFDFCDSSIRKKDWRCCKCGAQAT